MVLSWALSVLTVAAALYAVAARDAVRVQAAAVMTFALAGALAAVHGASILGGLLVWVLAGSAGVLGLGTVLLLNAGRDELTVRRIRIQGIVAVALLAWMGTGLLGAIANTSGADPAAMAAEGDLGTLLLGSESAAVALLGFALLTTLIAGLVIARRKV